MSRVIYLSTDEAEIEEKFRKTASSVTFHETPLGETKVMLVPAQRKLLLFFFYKRKKGKRVTAR